MTNLIIASALFFAIHSLIAGTGARYWLIDKISERGYMALFSLVSLGSIVWMAMAYNDASVNAVQPLWNFYPAMNIVTAVLMLPALILVVAGLTSKNPMSAQQGKLLEGDDPATGIMRITRHPFLNGVALWAVLHVLNNGDVASVIFFGTFLVVVVLGMAHIDAKRARAHGPAWKAFAAKTSRLPFLAIIQGRNSLKVGEIGAMRLLAGVLVYVTLFAFHRLIFGVPVMV